MGRAEDTRSTRKRRMPEGVVAVAVEIPVPFDQPHRDGIDDTRRFPVTRRRVVVQLELASRLGRRRGSRPGGPARAGRHAADHDRRAPPPVLPGRARVPRRDRHRAPPRWRGPRRRRAKPSAAVSRRGRPSSVPRSATTSWSSTMISMSWSGEYGGRPQHAASSRSAMSSSGSSPKRWDSSDTGARPCAGQPREHRQQAQQPRTGVGAPCHHGPRSRRAPGVVDAPPPPRASSPRRRGPLRGRGLRRGRPARRATTAAPTVLVTSRCRTTEPSSWRPSSEDSPTSSSTRAARAASTCTATVTRAPSPIRHGTSGSAASGSKPSGRTAEPGAATDTSPSMRSTLKVRGAARSRSWPTRYHHPPWNRSRAGSTRRRSPAVVEAHRGTRSQCAVQRGQRGQGWELGDGSGSGRGR